MFECKSTGTAAQPGADYDYYRRLSCISVLPYLLEPRVELTFHCVVIAVEVYL